MSNRIEQRCGAVYKYFRRDVITSRRFGCVECTQNFKYIRMGYLDRCSTEKRELAIDWLGEEQMNS